MKRGPILPVVALPSLSAQASSCSVSAAPGASLLLEGEGMKCGGCVRAVERRLLQQPGVREVSVNLLTRTAWLDLDPAAEAGADPLPDLQQALAELGFAARSREASLPLPALRERQRQRGWWQQWRQLIVALLLLLVSGLGHLADSSAQAWPAPWTQLASLPLHALVASLALAGPGRPILWRGLRDALAGMPGMDTLVGLGVASAYGSSLAGWLWPASGLPCFFNEPVMLLGFVLSGRFLEERARWRTGRALEALAALQPDEAMLLLGEGPPRPVRVGGLRPGDRLRLLPGDRVPVDGVVRHGRGSVDLAALTGESLPQAVEPGSELAAGSLNLEATLELEVLRPGAESALARIVHLVEQAQARRAPIQALADRVAGRFAIGVLLLALATLLFWWLRGAALWPAVLQQPAGGHGMGGGHGGVVLTPLGLALELAISVLVVACPCALGLATPTAISVGLAMAARSGLLFRGGDAIEVAASLRTVLFDKTGTLTLGRPLLTALQPEASGPEGLDGPRLLQLAASLEQGSRHPFAHALLQEAELRGLPLLPLASCRSVAGEGLEALLREAQPGIAPATPLRLGRLDWLAAQGVPLPASVPDCAAALEAGGASVLALAAGARLLGLLAVQDQPRSDAAATLAALRRRGLAVGLLSGDRRAPVEQLAARLGLEPAEIAWELRPEQKLARIEALQPGGPVAMVGDGINDAPALAAADLGIAVGSGTEIARESADLVVLGTGLAGVEQALELARHTMVRVRQNLAWAFGYNLIVLPIAAGALLPAFGMRLAPPLAALLMALSSITVVLNALLLQRLTPPERQG
jgi:Cu2+-exporting ATPase